MDRVARARRIINKKRNKSLEKMIVLSVLLDQIIELYYNYYYVRETLGSIKQYSDSNMLDKASSILEKVGEEEKECFIMNIKRDIGEYISLCEKLNRDRTQQERSRIEFLEKKYYYIINYGNLGKQDEMLTDYLDGKLLSIKEFYNCHKIPLPADIIEILKKMESLLEGRSEGYSAVIVKACKADIVELFNTGFHPEDEDYLDQKDVDGILDN